MMGESDPQRSMFYKLSLESFVPADHPLRHRLHPLFSLVNSKGCIDRLSLPPICRNSADGLQ